MRSGWAGCRDASATVNATVKTDVSPWYAVLVEPAKAKRI